MNIVTLKNLFIVFIFIHIHTNAKSEDKTTDHECKTHDKRIQATKIP
jgi:hypothetical protein